MITMAAWRGTQTGFNGENLPAGETVRRGVGKAERRWRKMGSENAIEAGAYHVLLVHSSIVRLLLVSGLLGSRGGSRRVCLQAAAGRRQQRRLLLHSRLLRRLRCTPRGGGRAGWMLIRHRHAQAPLVGRAGKRCSSASACARQPSSLPAGPGQQQPPPRQVQLGAQAGCCGNRAEPHLGQLPFQGEEGVLWRRLASQGSQRLLVLAPLLEVSGPHAPARRRVAGRGGAG